MLEIEVADALLSVKENIYTTWRTIKEDKDENINSLEIFHLVQVQHGEVCWTTHRHIG